MKFGSGPRLAFGRPRLTVAAGVLALLAGITGWVIARSFTVRDDLFAARTAITRMQAELVAGNTPGATAALSSAQRSSSAAAGITDGPAWALTANVPFAGRPIRVVRELAQDADELSRHILPELLAAVPRRGPQSPRAAVGQSAVLDLAAIARARAPLADAQSGLAGMTARLAALSPHSGLGAIDTARADLTTRLTRLEESVTAALTTARLLPPLLGEDGARRYFLAFQTNAEARGTGGLVGAYGVLVADHGHVGFPQLAVDDTIQPADHPVADFGPEFAQLYGSDESTQLLANSNLSPHFPYAAQIWTGLWQRQTGQRPDGAIATDPVGLADLLTVIGPVTLPDGEEVTSSNAVALTEQTAYARYPDPVVRKRFLIEVATQVVDALLNRPHSLIDLLHALAQTVSGGHLRVWSSDPAVESELAATSIGGVLPQALGPFAELVVNNASGTKLDYYLDRSLTYTLGPCHQGSRRSTVHVLLTNSAPATGLPVYGDDRLDDPAHAHVRGSNKLWVSVFAAPGAQLNAATLDRVPRVMSVNTERGHLVLGTAVELEPGQTRTLDISLTEPASTAPPIVPQQPLTHPQVTRINATSCQ